MTHPVAIVDQPLDGVGDLEFATWRRGDGTHGLVDGVVKQVHPHQGEVRRRVVWLFHQPDHLAVGTDLGHTETLGVVHVGQQDLGCGRVLGFGGFRRTVPVGLEGVDEPGNALAQQVVAEVHHEVLVAEVVLGDEYAVGQAERGVLGDVGDLDPEPRAVAHRLSDLGPGVTDDDADLGDTGGSHVLDPEKQDRFVGHRHQLLGAGVGDGAQAGACAAGEYEALHGVILAQVSCARRRPVGPQPRRRRCLPTATGTWPSARG